MVQEGKKVERNKRKGESWKSGRGRVCLYTWQRTGLVGEVGSDAILAKPDCVIQRYGDNDRGLESSVCAKHYPRLGLQNVSPLSARSLGLMTVRTERVILDKHGIPHL